jgi:hypothetical protein
MIGELPKSLNVNGCDYSIRSDFRDVLKILCAFNDPELENEEKIYVCLFILYENFNSIPQSDYEAAFKAALRFIDNGREPKENGKPLRVMDWEQDEQIMFPAVNKVAGYETRSCEYLHWWTFLGYYMEISEGVFSHILSLRMKKAKGKKLEKWEREYWSANKSICVLQVKLTSEEQAAKDRLNALLD